MAGHPQFPRSTPKNQALRIGRYSRAAAASPVHWARTRRGRAVQGHAARIAGVRHHPAWGRWFDELFAVALLVLCQFPRTVLIGRSPGIVPTSLTHILGVRAPSGARPAGSLYSQFDRCWMYI